MELPEFVKNAIIEAVELQDEKDGLSSNDKFDPDLEWVVQVVTSYRKGINYRRLRNMKDQKLLKIVKTAKGETREQLLKILGIEE